MEFLRYALFYSILKTFYICTCVMSFLSSTAVPPSGDINCIWTCSKVNLKIFNLNVSYHRLKRSLWVVIKCMLRCKWTKRLQKPHLNWFSHFGARWHQTILAQTYIICRYGHRFIKGKNTWNEITIYLIYESSVLWTFSSGISDHSVYGSS